MIEPRRGRENGRENGKDRSRDRGRERGRHQPSSMPKKASDPIFSAPYEPGTAAKPEPSTAKPEPQQQSSKRRQPQVAALLGGLKRA